MFTAACAIRVMVAAHAVVFFLFFPTHVGVEQVHTVQTLAPVDAALYATEGRFALDGARRGGCRDGARGWTGVYPRGEEKKNIRASKHASERRRLASKTKSPLATPQKKQEEEKENKIQQPCVSSILPKATVPPLERMTFREIYTWI